MSTLQHVRPYLAVGGILLVIGGAVSLASGVTGFATGNALTWDELSYRDGFSDVYAAHGTDPLQTCADGYEPLRVALGGGDKQGTYLCASEYQGSGPRVFGLSFEESACKTASLEVCPGLTQPIKPETYSWTSEGMAAESKEAISGLLCVYRADDSVCPAMTSSFVETLTLAPEATECVADEVRVSSLGNTDDTEVLAVEIAIQAGDFGSDVVWHLEGCACQGDCEGGPYDDQETVRVQAEVKGACTFVADDPSGAGWDGGSFSLYAGDEVIEDNPVDPGGTRLSFNRGDAAWDNRFTLCSSAVDNEQLAASTQGGPNGAAGGESSESGGCAGAQQDRVVQDRPSAVAPRNLTKPAGAGGERSGSNRAVSEDFDWDAAWAAGCYTWWIADGYCDGENNTEVCAWDGGDCCESMCDPTAWWQYTCGYAGYDCKDPAATSSPACTKDSCLTSDGADVAAAWADFEKSFLDDPESWYTIPASPGEDDFTRGARLTANATMAWLVSNWTCAADTSEITSADLFTRKIECAPNIAPTLKLTAVEFKCDRTVASGECALKMGDLSWTFTHANIKDFLKELIEGPDGKGIDDWTVEDVMEKAAAEAMEDIIDALPPLCEATESYKIALTAFDMVVCANDDEGQIKLNIAKPNGACGGATADIAKATFELSLKPGDGDAGDAPDNAASIWEFSAAHTGKGERKNANINDKKVVTIDAFPMGSVGLKVVHDLDTDLLTLCDTKSIATVTGYGAMVMAAGLGVDLWGLTEEAWAEISAFAEQAAAGTVTFAEEVGDKVEDGVYVAGEAIVDVAEEWDNVGATGSLVTRCPGWTCPVTGDVCVDGGAYFCDNGTWVEVEKETYCPGDYCSSFSNRAVCYNGGNSAWICDRSSGMWIQRDQAAVDAATDFGEDAIEEIFGLDLGW